MPRPVVSQAAEILYGRLWPHTLEDEANDWHLLKFCEALAGRLFEQVRSYVTDRDGENAVPEVKPVAQQLEEAVVTDTMKHAALPTSFTKLPWALSTGSINAEGWSPGTYSAGYKAGSRSDIYRNLEIITGGNAFVGLTKTTGTLPSPRQFHVWLFTDASEEPSGYQLAIIAESETKVKFVLRKWTAGVEKVLAEVKEVTFAAEDSFFLTAKEGKLAMWHRVGAAMPYMVGAEVLDETFTEGYSALGGNGSNPKLINFSTGILDVQGGLPAGTEMLGWEIIFNVDECPSEALAYLAKFVGVDLEADLTDEQKRDKIKERPAFSRGTVGAIEAAAKLRLTGDKFVLIEERFESPYKLFVQTFEHQTPDPAGTEADILTQKPAGIVLVYVSVPSKTYIEIREEYKTYTGLKAAGTYAEAIEP